jgi:hypothetical protein
MKTLGFVLSLLVLSVAHASSPEWEGLVETSSAYMNKQQKKLEADFRLTKQERWDFDQETGELIFSTDGKPTAVAKVQFVGSVSNISKTWLWSWANPTLLPAHTAKVKEVVKSYGETHDYSKLKDDKWKAEEVDGWEMAAITNYLLKAKGVYRAPYDKGASFMVITKIQHVKQKK